MLLFGNIVGFILLMFMLVHFYRKAEMLYFGFVCLLVVLCSYNLYRFVYPY